VQVTEVDSFHGRQADTHDSAVQSGVLDSEDDGLTVAP